MDIEFFFDHNKTWVEYGKEQLNYQDDKGSDIIHELQREQMNLFLLQ